MEHESILKKRAIAIFGTARQMLPEQSLSPLHRRRAKDFTRDCKLTFTIVMLLILQKSLKSLQLRLHEFMAGWFQAGGEKLSVTGGALTHARAKLLASAFIELNQKAVLSNFYGPEYQALVKRWRGYRLLAIDGSLVRLPSSKALFQEFGEIAIVNQHGKHDRYPQARISVLYDVLNGLVLEGQLVASAQGETQLGHTHLAQVQTNDVVLTDRGYAGYRWFVDCLQHGQFVCRCSCGSFAVVQQLMQRDQAGISLTVKLAAPADQMAQLKELGLPLELTV